MGSLVFAGMTAVDYVWARYYTYMQSGHRLRASLASALLTLLSYGVILVYVGTPWYVVPACLGAAFGTWLGTDPPVLPPGGDVVPT